LEGVMSNSKPVVWLAEDRKPNGFFFRSPFHSWKFLINTGLVAVVSVGFAGTLWKYWDKLNQKSQILLTLLGLLAINLVYPFLRALRRHRKINDLFAAGYITEQTPGSPLDEVLEVTDNAVNEALGNAVFLFGVFLVFVVMWKLR
jgi:hypothetical protein